MKSILTLTAVLYFHLLNAQAITSNRETCDKSYVIREGQNIYCECEYILYNKTNRAQPFKVIKDCGCVKFEISGNDDSKEGEIPANGSVNCKVVFRVSSSEDSELYDKKIDEIRSNNNSKLAEVGIDFTGTGDFIQLSSLFSFKFQ